MSDASTNGVEQPHPHITVIRYSSRSRWKGLLSPLALARAAPRILRMLRLGATLRNAVAAVVAADYVRELAIEHRIDVVSVYMLRPCFYLAATPSTSSVSPTVLTVFGDLFDDPDLTDSPELIRRVLNAADLLLSPSQYCANSVKLVDADPARFQVLVLGVDVRRFHPSVESAPLRQSLGLPESAVVILFLGRFDDEMGVGAALSCIPAILADHPEAVFVFAGARGRRSVDVERATEGWPGRVLMTENVPMEIVPSYMSLAAMLLAPSKAGHPCCGMAIKEAMASGTPVVATKTGGHSEVVDDGVTGFLIPLTSKGLPLAEALKARIDELLRNLSLRESMGAAGRAKAVATFDAKVTAEGMEAVFEAATAQVARDT